MTATAVPQHMVALKGANSVRLGRAAEHRRIAGLPRPAGCLCVAEMLEAAPKLIASMAIADLLLWIDHVGRSQARGILAHADEIGPISENRQIRQLTERQRRAVADHLRTAYESACPTGIPR